MSTLIHADDIAPLAAGCAIFGTGGGGSVHNIQLSVELAVRANGPVELITVDELGPDDVVLLLSGIGAPAVGIEMLSSDSQVSSLLVEAERYLGRPVTTFMAAEIGGGNGVAPVGWASRFGRKVLDADGMGRAFPMGTMVSMNVVGVPCEFGMLADVVGNVTLMRTVDIPWLERNARAIAVASGGMAISAHYPLTAETARGSLVEGTVSRAIEVGRALLAAPEPIAALTESLGAAALISGKLIDVERRTVEGFTRGVMTVEGVGDDRDRVVVLEVQNENLVALEKGEVLASVPDLITIVDTETGEAISTELLRFGQRVTVLAWACDPIWRTPRGLELVGPAAFGYDSLYVPIEENGR